MLLFRHPFQNDKTVKVGKQIVGCQSEGCREGVQPKEMVLGGNWFHLDFNDVLVN